MCVALVICFFFSSRRRHTRFKCDWSSDVCSSDLSMLDISVRYSNERIAFEKKISKFQAVQHNLARLAGESAAALAAATSAADTIAHSTSFDDPAFLEAASPKIPYTEPSQKRSATPPHAHTP